MGKKRLTTYDSADLLTSQEAIDAYVQTALDSGNKELVVEALKAANRAKKRLSRLKSQPKSDNS